ncbi:hypothetical protein QU24_05265 [Pantoea rodasii]|uniref:Uncharacterized protein n=2 Tax=Pantoea TaxID=53335 RepID=A0A0U3TGI3_9GAMM|nr:hypothetical protein LK04_11745 [Pantoea vagans]KHJ69126.1 hypothetical protein QU24_05265 [Pantoea rodasii]
MEDQAISPKTVRELQKLAAKAVKTVAVILETIRNALLKRVRKGDAVVIRNNTAVMFPSAGFIPAVTAIAIAPPHEQK